MKRVKSKLAIAVIAVAAIVLISAIGAYAYWSVSQLVSGNQLASGTMSIAVNDEGQQVVTPLIVSGLIPTSPPLNPASAGNKKVYTFKSAESNGGMLTDFVFSIPTVTGQGTLKDNVKVAFALTTSGNNAYWLEPAGASPIAVDVSTDDTYADHAFVMSDYALKSWADIPGYVDIPSGQLKHLVVYYYLPLDCANDCHDSSVTFDMSFELLQSH